MNEDEMNRSGAIPEGTPEEPRRHRRRSEMNRMDSSAQAAEPAGSPSEEAAGGTAEPVKMAADSRIPPEARRMSAAPYGQPNSALHRRSENRPAQQVRRPATDIRRPEYTSADAEPNRIPAGETSRISVGYAPGRMSLPRRTTQDFPQEPQPPREYGPEYRKNTEYGRETYGRKIYGQEPYSREPRNPETIRTLPTDRNRNSGAGTKAAIRCCGR